MERDGHNLREKAEKAITRQSSLRSQQEGSLTPEESSLAIHELRVHQIELEMQNEELRRVQEELAVSRARYFELYDLAPVGYFILSEKGIIQEANLKATDLLGIARSKIRMKPISSFILKEDQDVYYLHRKRLFETGEPQTCELRLQNSNGIIFWAHLDATMALDAAGNPVCRAVIDDITELKTSREKLENYKALLDQAQKLGKVGAWEFDIDTKIQTWTEEVYHIHEVQMDFVPTIKDGIEFYTPASRPIIEQAVQLSIERGESFDVELDIITAKGNLRTIHAIGKVDLQNRKVFGFFQDITTSRKVEEALQESEEKFRYLFVHSVVGKSMTRISGEMEVNPALSEMLGYTQEELDSMNWEAITHPDDIEMTRSEINRLLKREADTARFNKRFIRKDGSVIWVDLLSRLRRDAHGIPLYLMTSVVDITERRNFEKTLQESEEKYRLLITEMDQGMAVHEILLDESGVPINYRFLDINKGFETMTGLRREDIIGRTVLDVLPETETYWIEIYGRVALTGIPQHFENFAKELGRHFEVTAYSPKPGQFAVVISDITERIQMTEALAQSEERYKALFDYSGVAVGYYSSDGNVISYNHRAASNMGGEAKDFKGKSIYDLFPKEDAERYAKRIAKSLSRSDPQEYIDRILLPAGDLWFSSTFNRVLDARGKILGVQIVSLDISDRVFAEEKILQISYHDELTGLYNRRFYEEELLRLDTARNLPLSYIIGDVNGLKLINDSFGHAKGDELLRTVANVLKKECRADDIVARLSGDEFAVLLPKTNSAAAEQLVIRIRKGLAMERVGLLEVSVAFGFATKDVIELHFENVFKSAEDAMYRSKVYESQSIQNKTISLILTSLLENNYHEQQHSQRVSDYSVQMATRLGQSEEQIAKTRLAGLMHDIGKIGLRESVLNKPDRLTDEERKEMQNHPEIGHRILSAVSDFSEISTYVLQHHEHWDGGGYPKGLKGEDIQLTARIISVADAFDAITSERTYRESRSKEEAVEILRECSGSQFDPEIVNLFVTILENHV